MRVLDFVTRLFVRISPNNTAWCKTIEDFLDAQGYKLTTEVSRFYVRSLTLSDVLQLAGLPEALLWKRPAVVQ